MERCRMCTCYRCWARLVTVSADPSTTCSHARGEIVVQHVAKRSTALFAETLAVFHVDLAGHVPRHSLSRDFSAEYQNDIVHERILVDNVDRTWVFCRQRTG